MKQLPHNLLARPPKGHGIGNSAYQPSIHPQRSGFVSPIDCVLLLWHNTYGNQMQMHLAESHAGGNLIAVIPSCARSYETTGQELGNTDVVLLHLVCSGAEENTNSQVD